MQCSFVLISGLSFLSDTFSRQRIGLQRGNRRFHVQACRKARWSMSAPEEVGSAESGVPVTTSNASSASTSHGAAKEPTMQASLYAGDNESSSTYSPPAVQQAESVSSTEVPFEIRGFSLANLFLLAGTVITVVSFSSYFGSNATASATSLGFVYGVPVLLVGCALKYAELQPVPLSATKEGRTLRSKGTTIQQKIVSDITRHRYGDEAHLAAALSSLGLVPRGAACPELVAASESARDGKYCLTLKFYSVATPWEAWEERLDRYERFFGPGISAEVEKLDAEKRIVALRLIAVD